MTTFEEKPIYFVWGVEISSAGVNRKLEKVFASKDSAYGYSRKRLTEEASKPYTYYADVKQGVLAS